MMNAYNIVPSGTGRHVIAIQDDVLLAEDFDELLCRALLIANAQGKTYAMSLYLPNSPYVQYAKLGEATTLLTRKGGNAQDRRFLFEETNEHANVNGSASPKPGKNGRRKRKYRWQRHMEKKNNGGKTVRSRVRGSEPLLVDTYVWGHQAVVYSSAILDDFRAYFARCERSMMRILEATKAGDVHLIDEQPCIEPDDIFNKSFMRKRNRTTHTPFYTTRDSLVQHIGISSSIQNIDGKANQLFHYNVELGTVSEDYD